MIRFLTQTLCILLILISSKDVSAQLHKLIQKPSYDINGEGFDKDEVIDPAAAERLFWVIETEHDEKYNNPWKDSSQLMRFNEQLEFVLSCKRLKELHISIIDEVIHFPDGVKRIKELDSLRVLTIYFDDPIFMTTLDYEVILTDEIEEFSYRPFNLSLLRGMSRLEVFATNWNAEVHDPDALLDLTSLKYAQVPLASLQPDFFKNPNLEYVQSGDQLQMRWHKKQRKLKPWFNNIDLRGLFYGDSISLRTMEEATQKRKKPINWEEAFLQLNTAGDTVFHLRGSGKNYTIDFLKNSDNCERHGSEYRLKRNADVISANRNPNEDISRKSLVELIDGDTVMTISYVRLMTWKEQKIHLEFKDRFVNGKRTGNYDIFENGILNTRRVYEQDLLVESFPNDYNKFFSPHSELLEAFDQRIHLTYRGARLENDKIVQLIWNDILHERQRGSCQMYIGVNDTLFEGKTYALDLLGDTVMVRDYRNDTLDGRFYQKYVKRGKTTFEDYIYENGNRISGTIDDGTYVKVFDHREGVYLRFRQTIKGSGRVVAETFFHSDTNEVEYLFYDKRTGELNRRNIQKLE